MGAIQSAINQTLAMGAAGSLAVNHELNIKRDEKGQSVINRLMEEQLDNPKNVKLDAIKKELTNNKNIKLNKDNEMLEPKDVKVGPKTKSAYLNYITSMSHMQDSNNVSQMERNASNKAKKRLYNTLNTYRSQFKDKNGNYIIGGKSNTDPRVNKLIDEQLKNEYKEQRSKR